jgi:hypothetical protein
MAKTQLGAMLGQISGSIGGTTFSRNRYGTYARRRAHPTIVVSEAALAAKSRMAEVSRAWSGLTTDQQEAWKTWAANNPITDVLGERQVLSGNAAYIQVNNLLVYCGESQLSVPPVADPPPGLLSVTLTANIGAGDFEVAFTDTPLAAGNLLLVWVAVTDDESQEYVKNKLRLVAYSTTAKVSPWDIEAEVEARFGSLQVGQLVTVQLQVLDTNTGLRSLPLQDSAVVVST